MKHCRNCGRSIVKCEQSVLERFCPTMGIAAWWDGERDERALPKLVGYIHVWSGSHTCYPGEIPAGLDTIAVPEKETQP